MLHADRETDGLTDMEKLIVAFLDFANAPKKTRIVQRNDIRLSPLMLYN